MRQLAALVLLQLLWLTPAPAAENRAVVVTEPYVELHTGPGRGYPIFHVAGRGDTIAILKRRTDWFQVRTVRGVEGWVSREQILKTQESTGPLDLGEPSRENYLTRRWQGGVLAGDFSGASVISLFANYAFSDNLSLELTLSHVMGDFSNGALTTLGVVHVFAPEWRVSPYFGLGSGFIYIDPKVTLVKSADRTDQLAYGAAGIQGYLTRRFVVRFEYRDTVIFTSRDDNEEVDEWKLGFAFFL